MQAKPARSIILQPFEEADLPIAWSWAQSYWHMIADDFAIRDQRDFIEFKISQMAIQLGVWRDGELGGLLTCEPQSPVLCQAHAMFKKGIDRRDSFWGWDTTVPALQLGIDVAWKMGYSKIACLVFEDNAAMNKLLERVGGRLEGVLMNHTRREGQMVNMHQWGILKEGQ